MNAMHALIYVHCNLANELSSMHFQSSKQQDL